MAAHVRNRENSRSACGSAAAACRSEKTDDSRCRQNSICLSPSSLASFRISSIAFLGSSALYGSFQFKRNQLVRSSPDGDRRSPPSPGRFRSESTTPIQSEARLLGGNRENRALDHLRQHASGILARTSGICGSSGKLSRDMPAIRVRERPQTRLAHWFSCSFTCTSASGSSRT